MSHIMRNKALEILIIEDNQEYSLLIQNYIIKAQNKANFSVLENQTEINNFFQKKGKYINIAGPDFILLDLDTKAVNGLNILKRIKNDQSLNLKCIPVIVFGTSDNPQIITQAYENYANAFLSKPTNTSEFLQMLDILEQFWLHMVQLPVDNQFN